MATNDTERLIERIGQMSDDVFAYQAQLTAAKGVGPENGGQGETEKAALIEGWLAGMGITDIVHVDAPDERVASGVRPNLIATIPGRQERALWLFAHMDVVPAGDLNLWNTDPWTVVRDGDRLTGRGVEDNQQSLVSMLVLAKTLTDLSITPEFTLRLVFMSDEECANTKGLGWILAERPELFPADDMYIVPDGGSPMGNSIEIAEKGILWLRVTVRGTQCHASMPNKGVNAFVAASDIVLTLTGLAKDFKDKNELFDPPSSTFVPTRHELNVPGVNILPGTDIFYIDCRLLPGIRPEEVMDKARFRAETVAARRGVTVKIEPVSMQASSETPRNAPVVALLSDILAGEGREPHIMGMGGGTVAALLRKKGIPAVVWSTIDNTCHEPNEHSSIAATLGDASVFARIVMNHAG